MNSTVQDTGTNRAEARAEPRPEGGLNRVDQTFAASMSSGMGQLPLFHQPYGSENDSRYQEFCTDWFVPARKGRECASCRE
jgi:hypothetical protein